MEDRRSIVDDTAQHSAAHYEEAQNAALSFAKFSANAGSSVEEMKKAALDDPEDANTVVTSALDVSELPLFREQIHDDEVDDPEYIAHLKQMERDQPDEFASKSKSGASGASNQSKPIKPGRRSSGSKDTSGVAQAGSPFT